MTYNEYQGNHEEERREADGCDLCLWEDRKPWEAPCLVCKRNCMDLYERNTERYGERRTETLDERIKRGLKEWREK